jgi:hypothetical protein
LGPGECPATLPLQSLLAHVQRADNDAVGESAQEGKWAAQTEATIEGVSIARAAGRCDAHYTTAFRWRHRFLASLPGDKPKTLAGIVEADEPFILGSFKGKRSGMPRKSRKRGGKSAKRGLSAEQTPVTVAHDREGATTDAALPRLNRLFIAAAPGAVATPANEFCCDGGTAIVAFARRAGIAAHVLRMGARDHGVQHEEDVGPDGGEPSRVVPVAVSVRAFGSGKSFIEMNLAEPSARAESLLRVRRGRAWQCNTTTIISGKAPPTTC